MKWWRRIAFLIESRQAQTFLRFALDENALVTATELVVLFRASRVKEVVANMVQTIRLNANQHLVAAIPVRIDQSYCQYW